MLQSVSPVVKLIVQKILSQHDKFAKCPPELQSFAASLHFYSPKAYEYVRKTFMKILPHQSTIRSWYTKCTRLPWNMQTCITIFKRKG